MSEADVPRAEIVYRSIGVLRTPHTAPEETPVQPVFARGIAGWAEVAPAYAEGLAGLEGFGHIVVLFHLDRAGPARLRVVPHRQTEERGVFATRAPCRPNPIGLSVVRLVRREGAVLHIEDVDMLDGTPLLDIKPHVTRLDGRADEPPERRP
jgi:tRNA-Thr(GGU) m(6)t(6)A37 methyltransferase TsaA